MPDPTGANAPVFNDNFGKIGRRLGAAMHAIVLNPDDPTHPDPDVQRWINILAPSKDYPLGPGLLDDARTYAPSATSPQPGKTAEPANPEVAYAGTLIDRRSDGEMTHCTYYRPGLPTFTVPRPGDVACPDTTPAPGGYRG